uniref:Ovule protein n=1 Tax=Strongyloides papillosus TaxID=174720 RepID=A0A0N5BE39_STREA
MFIKDLGVQVIPSTARSKSFVSLLDSSMNVGYGQCSFSLFIELIIHLRNDGCSTTKISLRKLCCLAFYGLLDGLTREVNYIIIFFLLCIIKSYSGVNRNSYLM